MPARKKDSSTRARRNKASSQATLRRVADDLDTTAEEFATMTVAQLREAIDVVNLSRPADQQLSKRGAKTGLIDTLVAATSRVPEMPKHPPRYDGEGYAIPADWHPQTEAWWHDVWTSPMASEWDDSDLHNVFVVALLYDDIWTATTPRERKDALSEYRLQRADLGLSPYSRRRLEWTIETADEAKDRGARRRAGAGQPTPSPSRKRDRAADPRAVLSAVN